VSLAVFENVTLSFGAKNIVEALDLRISNVDRIGVVGANGSGKTSVLRMLAGQQTPDSGRIRLQNGMRLGYLPQDIELSTDRTLLGFVLASVQGRQELEREIEAAERALHDAEQASAKNASDEALQEALMDAASHLSDLHERATHFDLHYTEHEAMRILAGLGFKTTDHDRLIGEFSGGWKMRGVLASLLFQKPDLLLLDEPTNHLDMQSVTWFADFLKAYGRAFLLICHDREFLNEQIERVVSFEVEGVRQYTGDFERYVTQRAEEEIILENKAKNLAREREQTERFINRFRAQANKAKAVQSRVKKLDKMEEVETYSKRGVMRVRFPPTDRCGAEPIRVEHLAKRYGDHVVLNDVNLTVRRGERIGIIGVNGAGKTTLLRMMAGEIEPSGGEVKLASDARAGYYAQHHADTLHHADTIFSTVQHQDPYASITRVRSMLGAFLFSGDDVEKKIGVLSGGERARVALAKLLIKPGNLLLMDEPTNHLDLDSSEALAESLESYDGTLIFVSHNRSFVRRLATKIWNVEGGKVETFPGTLDEYMDSVRRRIAVAEGRTLPNQGKAAAKQDAKAAPQPQRESREDEKARKRREAEQRNGKTREKKLASDVATLEGVIEKLEAAQKERSAQLSDPNVYADKTKSQTLLNEFRDAQSELERTQAKWEQALTELEALRAAG
jgi:ATP-binding cassette subfamily F protein 3